MDGRKGTKIRLDSCCSFYRILGIGFGGADALPSLGNMTFDSFVGRMAVLGGVSVG